MSTEPNKLKYYLSLCSIRPFSVLNPKLLRHINEISVKPIYKTKSDLFEVISEICFHFFSCLNSTYCLTYYDKVKGYKNVINALDLYFAIRVHYSKSFSSVDNIFITTFIVMQNRSVFIRLKKYHFLSYMANGL